MLTLVLAIASSQALNLNKQPQPPATAAFGAALAVPETVDLMLSFPYNHLDPISVVTAVDGGVVAPDGGHAVLTVPGTGYAEMRTRESSRYVPGQGMSVRFTFTHTGCRARQEFEVGAGDDVDGFAFGCCPTCSPDGGPSFGVLRKSNGVDDWVSVERWNGAWGRTPPDITKGRPYQIQWQWLGYGQITYSIEDSATGGFVVAHAIKYAGTATETSISNPTLPLHAHVVSVGSDAGQTLRVPSMAMIRQGKDPELGVRRTFQASDPGVTTSGIEVFALRDRSTFNGRTNRGTIHVDFVSVSNTGTGGQDVIVSLVLNPTRTGGSFVAVSALSIADGDTTGTRTAGTGSELMSFVVGANQEFSFDLAPYKLHLAPGDVLSVVGTAATGTPPVRVALSWREEL